MKKIKIRIFVARLPMILSISGFAMAMQATVANAQAFPPVVDTGVHAQPLDAMGRAVQAPQINQVKAPPRPPGSANMEVHVGMSPHEVQRQERAHSHSRLQKKDHTRDDTRDDTRPTPKNK